VAGKKHVERPQEQMRTARRRFLIVASRCGSASGGLSSVTSRLRAESMAV